MTTISKYSAHNTLEGIDVILAQIRADQKSYSCIIAPVRGGLIPGVMLSHALGVPLFPIQFSLRDHKRVGHLPNVLISHVIENQKQPVLIVDDIVDAGDTIVGVTKAFSNAIPGIPYDVAALIYNTEQPFKVTYCHRQIQRSVQPDWFEFFWEI